MKLTDEQVNDLRAKHGWAKETIRAIEAEVLRLNGITGDGRGEVWEGGEEWEQLAWHLCAEENGEDACNELILEGGPIPEPWGDRWMKYEPEAKRMISLVRKYATPPQQAAQVAQPLTEDEIFKIRRETQGVTVPFARAIEAEVLRLNGITGDWRGEAVAHLWFLGDKKFTQWHAADASHLPWKSFPLYGAPPLQQQDDLPSLLKEQAA